MDELLGIVFVLAFRFFILYLVIKVTGKIAKRR